MNDALVSVYLTKDSAWNLTPVISSSSSSSSGSMIVACHEQMSDTEYAYGRTGRPERGAHRIVCDGASCLRTFAAAPGYHAKPAHATVPV